MKYVFNIEKTETVYASVTIEAGNEQQAKRKLDEMYDAGKLDANNIYQVSNDYIVEDDYEINNCEEYQDSELKDSKLTTVIA